MTEQKHIPPVTPKNFVVRYKASVERAFDNAEVKFPSIEDDNWEKLMEALSAEANKLLVNFQPSWPPPTPETGEKDGLPRVFLEMLNYPENKPNESGTYHVVVSDGVSSWPSVAMWTLGFWEIINTKDEDYEVFAFLQRIAHLPPPAQSDQKAAKKWISDHGVKFMAIEQQRNAFLAGCKHVRSQQPVDAVALDSFFKWWHENDYTWNGEEFEENAGHDDFQTYSPSELYTLFSSQTKQP